MLCPLGVGRESAIFMVLCRPGVRVGTARRSGPCEERWGGREGQMTKDLDEGGLEGPSRLDVANLRDAVN